MNQTWMLTFWFALPAAVIAAVAQGWWRARALRQQAAAAVERAAQLERALDEQRDAAAKAQAQRAELQAELRASEERADAALRSSQDGLWEWDLDAERVRLSPRWKAMLGFTHDELRDDRAAWRARLHEDDRAGFENALARHVDAAAAGDADARLDHEMRLVHKDGSVRWVLSRGVALRRADGKPYRVVGLDTDVTRIRRVLQVLDAVAAGTAGTSGEAFFPAMVRHFARALDVDCAFVTECVDHPVTRLRTLAFWSVDGFRTNFEFAASGTPCEAVVRDNQTCFHRSGVGTLFPREAGYEAYLGLPIVASDGRMLGHLAFLHRKPRGDELLAVDSIYRIFLARAAAEIERMQALARLREAFDSSTPPDAA
jgi:PAS domain S-box-containing protein